MKAFAAAAALVAGAQATYYGGYPVNTTSAVPPSYETASSSMDSYPTAAPSSAVHYTTKVVTELTTYCPEPTTITHGDKTYTVTSKTTLTITDCPCTVTEPIDPTEYPVSPSSKPVVPEVPEVPTTHVVPPAPVYPTANGTAPGPVKPTGTGVTPPEFTGAAAKMSAGVMAIAAAAAAFL